MVAWHLAKQHWGHGHATEAGHAVAHHAFLRGEDEIFAVVRPNNKRAAATAQRAGMEWVGETSKYYGLRLNVYRLRSGDLDVEATSRAVRAPANQIGAAKPGRGRASSWPLARQADVSATCTE